MRSPRRRSRTNGAISACEVGPKASTPDARLQIELAVRDRAPGESTQHGPNPHRVHWRAYVESFHSCSRDECLGANWFLDLADARHEVERWRRDYNEVRPHTSLAGGTPAEFAEAVRIATSLTRPSAPLSE
jgi:transposase InsO family protein